MSKITSLVFLVLVSGSLAVAQSPKPVLVELFTSEGCSSCPPADRLVLELEQNRQLDGVPIIVMGEHVDYWDHDGWRDRFSSQDVTLRQHQYREKLHFKEEYTPQAIINGSYEVVASDASALSQAIHTAANQASPVQLELKRGSSDTFEISVANPSRRKLHLQAAIVESGLSTQITGGENRGVALQHPAVLRRFVDLTTSSSAQVDQGFHLKAKQEWKAENLHVVAFVQDATTGAVLGAAEVSTR